MTDHIFSAVFALAELFSFSKLLRLCFFVFVTF